MHDSSQPLTETTSTASQDDAALRRYFELCGLTMEDIEEGEPESVTASTTIELDALPEAPVSETAPKASEGIRYSVRIREMPLSERPRERMIHYGPDALSTAELIAILLRTGTQQRSALNLAEYLLSSLNGLRGLASASIDELSNIPGIGEAKATQIKAAFECGRRLVALSPQERLRLHSPQDVYDLLGPGLREEKREHFVAVLLDTKGGVMRQRTVSVGDLSSSIVHPREVFREAIRHGAAAMIVAHNHPSGDPSPSPEDISVTRRLVQAGELIGIELLDHLILGDGKWISLKEKGLM